MAVLVVEDEALVLMDIAFHLEAEGYAVIEAINADDAIELLTAHPEMYRLLFTSRLGRTFEIIVTSGHHDVTRPTQWMSALV